MDLFNTKVLFIKSMNVVRHEQIRLFILLFFILLVFGDHAYLAHTHYLYIVSFV